MVSTPLKHISQFGWLFPIYGKITNVPNHQAENNLTVESPHEFLADFLYFSWSNHHQNPQRTGGNFHVGLEALEFLQLSQAEGCIHFAGLHVPTCPRGWLVDIFFLKTCLPQAGPSNTTNLHKGSNPPPPMNKILKEILTSTSLHKGSIPPPPMNNILNGKCL